jgi:NAD(P)-dependent dehydrogenase (short-subunit alcohol dehydrogenase family)
MSTLKGKVAVVTGGNSGLGYATAFELAARGAKVIITGRRKEAVSQAVEALNAELKGGAAEIGGGAGESRSVAGKIGGGERKIGGGAAEITGIVADQGSLQAIDQLVQLVGKDFGQVDILFINAGVAPFMPIEGTTEELFDQVMDINFKGAYFTLNKFLPLLSEGAAVTLLSSVVSGAAVPYSSVYTASKAALDSLTRVAAVELAPRKIRVNTISPGMFETPIFGKAGLDEATLKGYIETQTKRIPMNRIGQPFEIAKMVAYLSGPDAGFITGANYVIDGGVTLNTMS